MDKIDLDILEHLTENARMTIKELSEKVNLTAPAVTERINKLEQYGAIAGYTIVRGDRKDYIKAFIFFEPKDKIQALTSRTWDCIKNTYILCGEYTKLFEIECENMNKFAKILEEFRTIGNLRAEIVIEKIG